MNNVNWKLDPSHSEVNFKVKHMMISNVTGSFKSFDGAVSSDDDAFGNTAVHFAIDANSIDTNSEQRDTHLRSAEFFDVEKFPKIEFKGNKLTRVSGNNFKLEGDLSMHGVTKPISLEAELGGISKDPWGQTKAAFEINGKINRTDFGLNWNAALEAGGVLVSEDVRIHCEIQMIKA